MTYKAGSQSVVPDGRGEMVHCKTCTARLYPNRPHKCPGKIKLWDKAKVPKKSTATPRAIPAQRAAHDRSAKPQKASAVDLPLPNGRHPVQPPLHLPVRYPLPIEYPITTYAGQKKSWPTDDPSNDPQPVSSPVTGPLSCRMVWDDSAAKQDDRSDGEIL